MSPQTGILSGILSDIGHGLKIGVDVAAQDVRELVGRVPGIGKVSAVDKVDALTHGGTSSEALLKGDVKAQEAAMSAEQQAAGEKRWDTHGEDSAWRDEVVAQIQRAKDACALEGAQPATVPALYRRVIE